VRSPESSRFLASCWVMVEPPRMRMGGVGRFCAARWTAASSA
jgi:hypothetical protein